MFRDGHLLAGRYRILRFVARGGAGEVYEAEDQALGSRVALKTVRYERGTRPTSLERFKREINLARQVTHPNVCRIYEYGQHEQGDAVVVFLTMELLGGETLYERIRRAGPLPPREALPIVRQMAAGLDAAHAAGVVHRDFKSGNVILVPAEHEEGDVRAVITDFGLARLAPGEGSEPSHLTAKNTLVGTPAYMAPEQVRDGPISGATDLYAFGVVLYEMLTGQYPFGSEGGIATAIRRLTEPPSSPRIHRPDMETTWEKAILRCLERDPAKRYASGAEIVAELEDRSAHRRWARIGMAAALLAIAGAVATILQLGPRDPKDQAAPSARPRVADGAESFRAAVPSAGRRSIALLGFTNLSGQDEVAWLSTALSEMLATEAAAGDHLRVVPGDHVAQTKLELGVGSPGEMAAGTLSRLGELLGSDLVVVGSYLSAGVAGQRQIRLDLNVRETRRGEVVARISERGTESDVLDLVENAGRALRRSLDLADLSEDEARTVRASHPSGSEAARLYAEGLEQLRLHHAKAALELLEDAVELDPENPLIHTALSSAWSSLGYGLRSQEEGRQAYELAGRLGERDRLWVTARYRSSAGRRDEAVDSFRRLWDYFPDNPEYGLELADAQIGAGRPEDALESLAALRKLVQASPRAAGGRTLQEIRIDLVEAQAARSVADYTRQQGLAAGAARKAREMGAKLLEARARELEAGAWRDLGEPDRALAAYEDAKSRYAEADHRGPVARVLIAIAKVLRYQGRFDEARQLNEEALVVAREIGDQGSIKHALNTLAIILRQQGKLNEARRMHELELEANREVGDERSIQVALTSLGVAERRLGDLEGAKRRFAEALRLGRESGNQRSVAINLNLLGDVLLSQGRVEDARRHFDEALATNEKTRSQRGRAYYLTALGDVCLVTGDLPAARARYEEALEIRRSIHETTNVAYSLVSVANLEIEEDHPERAVEMAREGADEFAAEDKSDARAWALSVATRALLALGRTDEAREEIRLAAGLLEGSENRGYVIAVRIVAAEERLAAGDTAAAARLAREALEEAERLGFVDHQLGAGLVLGKVEQAAGSSARLEELVRRSRDLGFETVRRRGEAALRAGQTLSAGGRT